ncbi:YdeI/OmpD-associated family protein [Gaoshiqia sp. Z1-71]|uniref:YdeI/OmpD-associated family protein n=1 Tax=Gaoshiqia hydrogeniformans TaxID=3290090 RepID=UPI003BF8DEF4
MKGPVTAEEYILSTGKWQEALIVLREIMLAAGLAETVKWGCPVYTFNSKNICGIAAFKYYAGVWFYQGALLNDKQKKLMNAQAGVTNALRQWRFQSTDEVYENLELIQEYIGEAIENQKQNKTIKPVRNLPLSIPGELEQCFAENPELKTCFDAMSLANKRDFAEYIHQAKRPETKQRRLDKIIPMILGGDGLNDKYKNK